MARVERFITGQTPLEAPRLNQLADACNAFLNMRVSGAEFKVSGDMASLIIAPGSEAFGAAAKFPFGISNASVESQLRIRLRPGRVNGITPTAGGRLLTDADHFLPITGISVVFLRATVSEDTATYGELERAEVLAAPTLPDVTFAHPVIRLGTVTVSDSRISAISQDVFASLQLVRFFQHYVWVPGGPAAAS